MSAYLPTRPRSVVALCLALLVMEGSALAAEVRDDARFFGAEAVSKANARIAEFAKNGPELHIETLERLPEKAGNVSRMSKDERDRFFEKWARNRANAEKIHGIYVVITRDPGHVQVEAGQTARKAGFGDAELRRLRDILLDGFRHKEYDRALQEGVDFVASTKRTEQRPNAETAPYLPGPREATDRGAADRGAAAPAPRPVPHERPPQATGMGWIGWIILIVVVLVGIRLLGALFRAFSGGGPPAGGGYGPGPGYGGPGYGGPGSGGGGMAGGLMSGLFGAFAGNWLYHSMFGNSAHAQEPPAYREHDRGEAGSVDRGNDEDYRGAGGDFGGGDSGGGDFGNDGGGDPGGGDFGGGDFGGGGGDGGGDF